MYQVITDFRGGLDARKFKLALPPGTLTELVNGHITSGGEIEKRKAFAATTLPAGTFGACPVPAGIMVFGSSSAAAIGAMPTGFFYTQLIHPDGATAMSAAVSSVLNGDYPFVVARFADGKSFAYYNGVLVNDFTSGLVMAHLNTNVLLAAAFTNVVNQSGSYTAVQDANPNDNKFDTFSQPGNSYAATVSIASTSNITVTSTNDSDFTGAVLTATNGLNAVTGAKLMIGGKDYTFRTALTPTEGEVLIGLTIGATMTNLFNAINHTGTPNTDYKCAAINANFYAQNLITAGTPTFEVVARVANVQGATSNAAAGMTYEDDAPTVTKAVAVQAVGQFKISALNPVSNTLATALIKTNGTNPGTGSSLTINGQAYTFTNAGGTLTTARQVKIGANLAATFDNLIKCINLTGVAGTDYGNLTVINTYVTASARSGTGGSATFNLIAKTSGVAGNVTLASADGRISVPPTLAGGAESSISTITVGKIFGTGTLTTNGTNPTDHDTVTVGSITYRFCASLTDGATNDVLIGANARTTLTNLLQAINGTGVQTVDYIIANPNPDVIALPSLNGNILQVNARLAGVAGNSIALATPVGTTITRSAATLAGGSEAVSLILAPVNSHAGQPLNDFCLSVVAAINNYTSTSGYTAKLIGNTIYIYAQAGNSFSNNADITVTVAGQVAIGFCAFLISNGINENSGAQFPTGNGSVGGTARKVSGVVKGIQVDGFDATLYEHELGAANTGTVASNTQSTTISGLITAMASDITANYPTAIFAYGLTAVPVGNTLFIARLITKSSDTPLNVSVRINTTGYMFSTQVDQDGLSATVTPLTVNFLRYAIGGTFTHVGTLQQVTLGLGFGTDILSRTGLIGSSKPKMKTASYAPQVCTCQATGGYPPYKYLWSKKTGADGFEFSAPNDPSGTFSRPDNAGANNSFWVCTVTDSLGNSVESNAVKVYQP